MTAVGTLRKNSHVTQSFEIQIENVNLSGSQTNWWAGHRHSLTGCKKCSSFCSDQNDISRINRSPRSCYWRLGVKIALPNRLYTVTQNLYINVASSTSGDVLVEQWPTHFLLRRVSHVILVNSLTSASPKLELFRFNLQRPSTPRGPEPHSLWCELKGFIHLWQASICGAPQPLSSSLPFSHTQNWLQKVH